MILWKAADRHHHHHHHRPSPSSPPGLGQSVHQLDVRRVGGSEGEGGALPASLQEGVAFFTVPLHCCESISFLNHFDPLIAFLTRWHHVRPLSGDRAEKLGCPAWMSQPPEPSSAADFESLPSRSCGGKLLHILAPPLAISAARRNLALCFRLIV